MRITWTTVLFVVMGLWIFGFLKPIGLTAPFTTETQTSPVQQPSPTEIVQQPTETVWEVVNKQVQLENNPPSVTSGSVQLEIAFYIVLIAITIAVYFVIKNWNLFIISE